MKSKVRQILEDCFNDIHIGVVDKNIFDIDRAEKEIIELITKVTAEYLLWKETGMDKVIYRGNRN